MSKLKAKNYNLNFKTDLRKRSFTFSLKLIGFINKLPNKKVYWVISDQLLRSGALIGANMIGASLPTLKGKR